MSTKDEEFLQITGDEDFKKRSHSIFDGLNSLEPPKHEEIETESRPIARGRKRRPQRVPDHVLHPEKWKKYSLEEDGSEEFSGVMPNDLNKHVATSFISELKERKKSGSGIKSSAKESGLRSDVEESKKHTYSVPKAVENKEANSTSSVSGLSKAGVIMMPEYVVGKSTPSGPKKHPRKDLIVASDKTSKDQKPEVGISHLNEEDTDDITSERQDGESIKETETPPSESLVSAEEKATFTKRKCRQPKGLRKHAGTDNED